MFGNSNLIKANEKLLINPRQVISVVERTHKNCVGIRTVDGVMYDISPVKGQTLGALMKGITKKVNKGAA